MEIIFSLIEVSISPFTRFIFLLGQIFVSNKFKLEGEPTTKAFLNLKSELTPNSFLKV